MRGLPIASLLGLAACDLAFGIEPPPDCPVLADHDEDADGLDDNCDPCPFKPDNRGDDDDDGIADACDPEPAIPNVRLLFTGFGVGSLTAFSVTGGGGIANDAFHVSTTAHLLWTSEPLDRVWIVAGVTVNALGDGGYREIGVIVDGSPGPDARPNGTFCTFGKTGDGRSYIGNFIAARPANDISIASSEPSFPIEGLVDGSLVAWHELAASPSLTCAFRTATSETSTSGTRTPAPPAGRIGLTALSIDADFSYLFVVGRP
ncbi:MAG: hypothetical protein H0T89_07910 [Deltaproteobacteria bacterium]|nr:hypothetical protein [Deltaproteobacteria bacterium]MDQ3301304.1 hypothetical protein [Myxococcota bacterium]